MMLNRRAFLCGTKCAALGAPLAATAQQPGKVYRIGFLLPVFDPFTIYSRIPFRLEELGWRQNVNASFETRWAVDNSDDLADLARELASVGVDVIVVPGTSAALAAKRGAPRVQVVAIFDRDPVEAGAIASLGGGNVTGVATLGVELTGKRLEILREAVPGLSRVGVLWNPAIGEAADYYWREAKRAAGPLGLEVVPLMVPQPVELEPSVRAAQRARCEALLVLFRDGLMRSQGPALAALALNARLPTLYPDRFFIDPIGGTGLMSFGEDYVDVATRVAAQIDNVLKGARAANLPVERPTTYELVINLQVARALGLTIPPSLLLRANKVIE